MKKRVIIGDIHGQDLWKKIVEKENPDMTIFLGDYFDSFHILPEVQKENFLNIIEYKESRPSFSVRLLLGNHDYHYIGSIIGEQYSGWNSETASKVGYILGQQLDNGMDIVFIDGENKTIYSHAGVSEKWINHWCNNSLGLINTVDLKAFGFTYRDGGDWYGSSEWNGPLWIRPEGLFKNPYKDEDGTVWNQVFGHTHQHQPTKFVKYDAEFWNMDCLDDGYYLVEKLDDKGKLINREIRNILKD